MSKIQNVPRTSKNRALTDTARNYQERALTDKNRYVECDHGRHARGDKAWSKAEAVQSTASHCEAQSKQSASIATITAITAIKSGAFLSLAAAPDEWHGAVAIWLFQAHWTDKDPSHRSLRNGDTRVKQVPSPSTLKTIKRTSRAARRHVANLYEENCVSWGQPVTLTLCIACSIACSIAKDIA